MKALLALAVLAVVTPLVLIGIVSAPSSAHPCATACGPVAEPFHGPDGLVADPTSSGRITHRMLHVLKEADQAFNGWPWGIACWDPHTWNPTSDHPRGRACDFTVGRIGTRPGASDRKLGWELADWARANAHRLGISYVIWDGRIWSAARTASGWRPYNGAGIYNPTSITGGHFDHVHISVRTHVGNS